jgi:hypothetical protein
MKVIVLYAMALLSVFIPACNKNKDTVPPNTNEINATVLLTTGSTITINAKGTKAVMGCTLLGGGNFLYGTSDNNAYVYLGSIYGPGFSCVSAPGTYPLVCEYKTNRADPATRAWSNMGTNRGSITFTVVNDHYLEGHFNAVSKCISAGCGSSSMDTVVINGTFKGNY